jgi:hypothetical protein
MEAEVPRSCLGAPFTAAGSAVMRDDGKSLRPTLLACAWCSEFGLQHDNYLCEIF